MRVKNSTNNIIASIIGQIFALFITFLNRTIFIRFLEIELLGIQGLFTNIFSILSLSEMGFAIAITYSLYKPLAENNQHMVNGLLNFFRIIYFRIGLFTLVIGSLLTPFLHLIIKSDTSIPHIHLYYGIFLLNNVVIYLFSYKRFLLIADQKNYIVISIHYICFFVSNIIQIITMIFLQNFALFLAINVISLLVENLTISIWVNKKYPFTKGLKKYSLDKELLSGIKKNIYALSYHKIGSVLINGSDSLLISTFIGINTLGIYSNYILVIQALNLLLGQIFGNLTASIGNLIALKKIEQSRSLFSSILLANFWVYGILSTAFYILTKDFITMWLGQEFLLPTNTVLLMSINFFLHGTRKTTLIFKDAMGLFWYDRLKPLAEIFVKMCFVLLLLPDIKLDNIFIASIISVTSTCLWVEPYVVFRFGFKFSIIGFIKEYFSYLLITGLAFISIAYLSSKIILPPMLNIISKATLCFVIYSAFFYVLVHNKKEFTGLIVLIKSAISSIKRLFSFAF